MSRILQFVTNPEQWNGTVRLPSSKSLSNRALVLKYLHNPAIEIFELSIAGDTRRMYEFLENPGEKIDCGNAGTVLRFLTAYFTMQPGTQVLTGNRAMKKRPAGPLVDALRKLGARVDYLENEGFPPLKVGDKMPEGGSVELDPGISSQFITALLLIAPALPRGLHLKFTGIPVSRPYFMMTVKMLRYFGIKVRQNSNEVWVAPGKLKSGTLRIEPDWSAASFWLTLLSLYPGSELYFPGLAKNSWQGDKALIHLLNPFGVEFEFQKNKGVKVISHHWVPDHFEGLFSDHPDLVQAISVLCTLRKVPFQFKGVRSLRIKETDRIFALETELKKLGAGVRTGEGELLCSEFGKVPGEEILINTHGDHRMAMSFAAAAAYYPNILINDPEVVDKSYPGFWEECMKLGAKIRYRSSGKISMKTNP